MVKSNKDDLEAAPQEWLDNGMLDSAVIAAHRKDGDYIRCFVQATDVAQHIMVRYIRVTNILQAKNMTEYTVINFINVFLGLTQRHIHI